jgi:hypothetical protein
MDTLSGGTGNDTFVFQDGETSFAFTDSRGLYHVDRITDFSLGDRIDLGDIDANAGRAGNQGFRFVETYTGAAGELMVRRIEDGAEQDVFRVSGDITGDRLRRLPDPGLGNERAPARDAGVLPALAPGPGVRQRAGPSPPPGPAPAKNSPAARAGRSTRSA